jgi:hypothetical protein
MVLTVRGLVSARDLEAEMRRRRATAPRVKLAVGDNKRIELPAPEMK